MENQIGELYRKLKSMVRGGIEIEMRDKGESCEVYLVSTSDKYHWTHFVGRTLETALEKAINRLLHPDMDYVDENGHVWKADGGSVFGAVHIRSFLTCVTECTEHEPAWTEDDYGTNWLVCKKCGETLGEEKGGAENVVGFRRSNSETKVRGLRRNA